MSDRSPAAPPDLSRALLALLVLMIIIGSVSRFVGLAHLPIWHDEAFTLVRVFGYSGTQWWDALFSGDLLTPAQVLRFQQPDPTLGWAATWQALTEHPEHAPLYYLIGRAATDLPVDPVTALRGTAAVFGVLLSFAVFWLMRELFGRGALPWVAAALVACSPMHLLYAQEARQYSLWLLLVVVATATLVRALRERRRLDWWLYGASLVIGLWSHLLFVLLLPIHAAYGWLLASQPPGRLWRPRNLAWRPWLIAVGIAGLLFLPWVAVLVGGHENAANFTDWMKRAVGAQVNLTHWGHHFVRAFVDLTPAPIPPTLALWLLPALAVPLAAFLLSAPRPARWLLAMIALVYLGIVLGPDLLFGGSRSQHVRYGLPAVLAVQLMIAWGLAAGLHRGSRTRSIAASAIVVLLIAGLLSQWRIQQAETWWNKQYSANNYQVAALINAGDRPLVAVTGSGLPAGELLSLAYHLAPEVRVFGHGAGTVSLPAGFGDILLLLPNGELIAAAQPGRDLQPVADTWQWFLARPVNANPPPSVLP